MGESQERVPIKSRLGLTPIVIEGRYYRQQIEKTISYTLMSKVVSAVPKLSGLISYQDTGLNSH
jgi:hypothetical protein